jgi:hypothetical protein
LEEGGVLRILLQKANELAIFADRAEAQDRYVDQQEILIAALVVGQKPLSLHADDLDRHAAWGGDGVRVDISGR